MGSKTDSATNFGRNGWYFYVKEARFSAGASAGKICRFYSLAPYLDRAYCGRTSPRAIQKTAWKMMDDSDIPTIRFSTQKQSC